MGRKKKTTPQAEHHIQSELNKIIYFDKETINNILQEYNKGKKQTVVNSNDSASIKVDSNIESEASIKIPLPFFSRVKFLISSKISAEYISKIDKMVTITSTEISDFEKIKSNFKEFSNITISDIENSSTFFRVAGNYIRILKGGVKDVDTKEFKSVMEGYEGYDHYKIDYETYIRFNSAAFLSNYRRNDLLNSHLKIYCICIGKFPQSNFNFIEQLNKMQKLSTGTSSQTLGDMYPSLNKTPLNEIDDNIPTVPPSAPPQICLYDVVYASICYREDKNENI